MKVIDSDPKTGTSTGGFDKNNNVFWDFICGSTQARGMGVVDDGPQSLAIFDKWYFDFYPYLKGHVLGGSVAGQDVLEIGLGMGTVGQYLADQGANYVGLDVADGPVTLMNHRLAQSKLPGTARLGSILNAPFEDASFDSIVAIGALHHTGDLARSISECRRILRPNGRLTFMVYHAYSYRRFEHQRAITWAYFCRELFGYRGTVGVADEAARAAADTNSSGVAAPHTDWVSKTSMRAMLKSIGFQSSIVKLENMDQAGPFKGDNRELLLDSIWCKMWGLDLYVTARA